MHALIVDVSYSIGCLQAVNSKVNLVGGNSTSELVLCGMLWDLSLFRVAFVVERFCGI